MQNKEILLVDDEEIILKSLAQKLEKENFSITKAASGETAITLLRDNKYNLVVTDLVMQGVDGIQVLKEAKKKDHSICVVIMTGYGDMANVIDALRFGADDYLLKPYEYDEFIIRINRCIDKQKTLKKIQFYENILPICMYCKNIRDDACTNPGKGKWMSLEKYLNIKSGTNVSHTFCPLCQEQALKDMMGN